MESFNEPYRETREWGSFIRFSKNTSSTVKLLTVNAGQAFSLQKHQKREEGWFVISGNGVIQMGEERNDIEVGKTYFIPKETLHRLEAGDEAVVVLEVSFGEFDEKDITRLDDRYGRS
ncbi:MAG: phosphomannose isomerase type II C-terminal cupin domain [bacterium]|nr:phosphomannose isomerase type II C-terminal cupin domain [bacterium]